MMDEMRNIESLEGLAEDALRKFETVSRAALSELEDRFEPDVEGLVHVNVANNPRAIGELGRIHHTNRQTYQLLAEEPAIARVKVSVGGAEDRVYYICRTAPVSGIPLLASYRSPVGRLASLPIGSEFTLPNGELLEILEQARFHPALRNRIWDSYDTVIETDDYGPVTVESLRQLLDQGLGTDIDEDLLGQLLADEMRKANVFEGVRRGVITKMALRDQPILDQYQDEIFRLPLDSRLLILGPPGTGKTTTLIRRLGQKLDLETLGPDEDEYRMVARISEAGHLPHRQSWLMFTPTELLKQYLKEAFSREGVPAPDERIRTWADLRRQLARNTFGVLRNAAGGGLFVLDDTPGNLSDAAVHQAMEWFLDFDKWQTGHFLDELRQAGSRLSTNPAPEVAQIGERLLSLVDVSGRAVPETVLMALVNESESVRKLRARLKSQTDKVIGEELNRQLNRDKGFLDDFVALLDSLQGAATGVDREEMEDGDSEGEGYGDAEADDEDEVGSRTPRGVALATYMNVVRRYARARARKRKTGEHTRDARILAWLGERIPSDERLTALGHSLLVQSDLGKFANPVKRYLSGVPRRYKRFRRIRQKEGWWYSDDSIARSEIHPLELDIVLLAILKGGRSLLAKDRGTRERNPEVVAALEPVRGLFRNQVLVDEATDFSPVQLACMASMTHPQLSSFFACGDFNQRLTPWGTRSLTELERGFPEKFDTREITIAYRQSRQLAELASRIIETAGGVAPEASFPPHVDSNGFSPALLEACGDRHASVAWLAERIREIERLVGQMPSIAVFVDGEELVPRVADALNQELAKENAHVVACSNGLVVGQENDVRVFDVQHIKGLEFEAVFFVGVDRLAESKPELFDKFLYVGATRAATYLGITCDDVLPAEMSSLKELFVPHWRLQ